MCIKYKQINNIIIYRYVLTIKTRVLCISVSWMSTFSKTNASHTAMNNTAPKSH